MCFTSHINARQLTGRACAAKLRYFYHRRVIATTAVSRLCFVWHCAWMVLCESFSIRLTDLCKCVPVIEQQHCVLRRLAPRRVKMCNLRSNFTLDLAQLAFAHVILDQWNTYSHSGFVASFQRGNEKPTHGRGHRCSKPLQQNNFWCALGLSVKFV